MQDYSHTLLCRDFMNLTEDVVLVYEESSGNIIGFNPIKCVLPPYTEDYANPTPPQYYIVNADKLKEIKDSGRELCDIVLLEYKSRGRDNQVISYLVWANDLSVKVKLHKYHRIYGYSFWVDPPSLPQPTPA